MLRCPESETPCISYIAVESSLATGMAGNQRDNLELQRKPTQLRNLLPRFYRNDQ